MDKNALTHSTAQASYILKLTGVPNFHLFTPSHFYHCEHATLEGHGEPASYP